MNKQHEPNSITNTIIKIRRKVKQEKCKRDLKWIIRCMDTICKPGNNLAEMNGYGFPTFFVGFDLGLGSNCYVSSVNIFRYSSINTNKTRANYVTLNQSSVL